MISVFVLKLEHKIYFVYNLFKRLPVFTVLRRVKIINLISELVPYQSLYLFEVCTSLEVFFPHPTMAGCREGFSRNIESISISLPFPHFSQFPSCTTASH